jgi:hypothetical protein
VGDRADAAPDDELLRSLYGGILGHFAGSYDSSSIALQRAADLADDRYTKRISRAALSLITHDKVLPYEPGDTERLLIHYYAALNYLTQGDRVSGAVEARRLSALLERYEGPDASALHGWLRYFSGMVFEAAGEWNDADVAYRNARLLLGPEVSVPGGESAGGARTGVRGAGGGSGLGEVVVLVEQGFVAHRVEQAIVLPLYSFEMDRLSGGGTGERLTAAAGITTRILAYALSAGGQGQYYHEARPRTLNVPPLPREAVLRECAEIATKAATDDAGQDRGEKVSPTRPSSSKNPVPAQLASPGTVTGSAGGRRDAAQRPPPRSAAPRGSSARDCADTRNPYLLRIAWPVFRQERSPLSSLRIVANGGPGRSGGEVIAEESPGMIPAGSTVEPIQLRADLSAAVRADFEEERSAILARTIVRGVAKAVVTRSIEKAPGEDAEGWGRLLGAIVNLGTALLEQADTRSWQLLPDHLGVVRLQLPPGEHELAIEVSAAGGAPRTIELGSVQVRAGEMSFHSARVWH